MTNKRAWELTPLRKIHLVLLLASLVGIVGAISSSLKLRRLNAERTQLQVELGDFGSYDPNKFKLMKLPSKGERELRWRYFQPSSIAPLEQIHFGWQGGGPVTHATIREVDEQLFRLKLYQAGEDVFLFYTPAYDSGRWKITDPLAAKLLSEHWDELAFEVSKDAEIQEFGAGEIITVIRISAPLSLLRKLGDKEHHDDLQLLWIRVGDYVAFNQEGLP